MPATRRGISSYRHTALLGFPALVVIDTLPCWVFQLDVCACFCIHILHNRHTCTGEAFSLYFLFYLWFTCLHESSAWEWVMSAWNPGTGHNLGTRYQRMMRVLVSYALLSVFTRCLAIYQENIRENGYAFSHKTCAITLKIAKKLQLFRMGS